MNYLSVCSGIEAATVAWHPLGWTPVVAFAEVEAFPSAVLAHHYGSNLPGEALTSNGVPNFGDITKFKEWPDAAIDVLVGGTPCQSFSVAGLRKGLADPRGNLALVYLAIADRYRPEWIVWENVPGVLSSSEGRDFGAFVGGLGELGYHAAWRVLDAQYVRVDGFGRAVPQRRRRVFVVGHLGDWRRAAAVLFEPESMSGNSPPRRQTGQGVAPTISARHYRRWNRPPGTDVDTCETLIPLQVSHALRGEGFDASEDGTGRGVPLVVGALCKDSFSGGAGGRPEGATAGHFLPFAIQERAISENPDNGPDGAGVRTDGAAYTMEARSVPQAVAFQPRFARNDRGAPSEIAHALTGEAGRTGKGDSAQCVQVGWAVRRLMPLECERLQGFPDRYTEAPFRGKAAADGPRYKALGNSMAVNAMRWLGRRIELVCNQSKISP
jgi:DNA (cytosine-5)-methyltransferase 1